MDRRQLAVKLAPYIVPLVFAAIAFLAYGLLIRELGFFWDDWPAAWFTHAFGSSGFQEVFEIDRPLLGWLYQFTTPLMGTSALRWQAFALLARWLSACLFWLVLLSVWPDRRWQVTSAALLFLIYPGFSQQPIAITYSHVWLLQGVFFVSLVVMLWAAWRPRWYWPLNIIGWLLSALVQFTVEYFFGLGLLRPVLLWLVYARSIPDHRLRLRKTFAHWLPYLAINILFLIWRLFLTETPRGEVSIFSRLLTEPVAAISGLLTNIQEALVESSFSAWGQIFRFQDWFSLSSLSDNWPILIVILASLLSAGLLIYLRNIDQPAKQEPSERWNWGKQAVGLGLLAMLLAGIPFWMAGLPIRLSFPWDRFTLAMMVGVCLLLAGLLDVVLKKRSYQIIAICLLVGFATSLNYKNARAYASRWDTTSEFFWQIIWRAPQIEPNTILMTDNWPFERNTDNSLTAPLNWIYASDFNGQDLPYLIVDISTRLGLNLPALEPGLEVKENYRAAEFAGNTSDTILFYYEPPACVRILNPQIDRDVFGYPATLYEALPLSNLSRIVPEPATPATPPEVLVPPANRDWCYYYQKVDLAVQLGQFNVARELGDEAFAQRLRAHSAYEYLPFIEAYARTDQWSRAFSLTERAYSQTHATRPALCRLWEKLALDAPSTQRPAIDNAQQSLNCISP